jgi:hypothetical protein
MAISFFIPDTHSADDKISEVPVQLKGNGFKQLQFIPPLNGAGFEQVRVCLLAHVVLFTS